MYLATASDGKVQYADAARMNPDELFDAYAFYGELNKSQGKMTLNQAKRAMRHE